MVALLTTLGGYAFVVAVVALYWFYIQNSDRNRHTPRRGPSAVERSTPRQQTSPKSKRLEKSYTSDQGAIDANATGSATGSSGEQSKDRKNHKNKKDHKPLSSPAGAAVVTEMQQSVPPSLNKKDNAGEGADDLAFAAQLAKTQQGMTLKAGEKASQKVKTHKQGKANKVAEEIASSSSTTGAEADDDLSSSYTSPVLNATMPSVSDPTGVADMLEATAPGPSSIRITPGKDSERKQKTSAVKKESEVETKKQRQRRKKNEERKAVLAESEAERKKLAEQQMRTARILDGSSKIQASLKAPTSNAWSKLEASSGDVFEEPSTQAALLDTFEPSQEEAKPARVKQEKVTVNGGNHSVAVNGYSEHLSNSPGGLATSTGQSSQSQPSSDSVGEWEKIPDNLLAEDDGWQAATSKSSKKKSKKVAAATVTGGATGPS